MGYRKEIEALALQAFEQSNKQRTGITQLLTKRERIQIGRRILIAQSIIAGKTRYEISNHIKISPNTFTQIKRWLELEFSENYTSAYKKVITTRKFTKERSVQPYTYQQLKRSYPGHFLLFSLVEELFSITRE